MVVYNNKLCFRANSPVPAGVSRPDTELWVYDGTNAPTMVDDFWEGSVGGLEVSPYGLTDGSMVVYNNKLYFGASDGSYKGHELHAYDGANISIIHDVVNGTHGSWFSEEYGGSSGAPVPSTRHRTDNICTT